MRVKMTSKNQITLPKAVADMFPDATYFDISTEEGTIVLVARVSRPVEYG